MDVLILLLLVINQLTARSSNPYEDLEPVPYAYRRVTNEGYIYKCYDGFVHTSGNLTRHLALNDTPPVCTRNCGHPPLLPLTSLMSNKNSENYLTGSRATYNCSVGNITTIICPDGDGDWPIWEIDCRDTKRLEIISAKLSSRQESDSSQLDISVDRLNGSLSDQKTLTRGQCIGTGPEKEPFIDLKLGQENFEIHRLEFTTPTDMEYNASRLEIRTDGSQLKPTEVCWNRNKDVTSGQVISVICRGKPLTAVGTNVRLKVKFPDSTNKTGKLQICDLHVYGAKFKSANVECGNPPPYYGMRVQQPVHSTRYLGQAVYVCEDGFFHTGGSGISTCGIGGKWTEPDRDCSDEGNILNAEKLILPSPTFVDSNLTTCGMPPDTLILKLDKEDEVATLLVTFKGHERNTTLVVEVRGTDGEHKQCENAQSTIHYIMVECEPGTKGNTIILQFIPSKNVELCETSVRDGDSKTLTARLFNTSLLMDGDLSTCADLSDPLNLEFDLQHLYEVTTVTVVFGEAVQNVILAVYVQKTGFAPRLCDNYTGEVTMEPTADTSTSSYPLTVDCMERRPAGRVLRLLLSGLESAVQICELRVTGRKYEESLECSQTVEGWDYKGTVNMSISGRTCLRWDQVNESVVFEDKMFNDDLQENFCRVPDVPESRSVGNTIRPWCYTADGRREYCPVARCDKLCSQDSTGILYSGQMSQEQCENWIGSPFSLSSTFSDPSINNNYCRNPGKSRLKSWCYTNKEKIADCDVPPCLTSLPKPAFDKFHHVHSLRETNDTWECYFYNLFDVDNPRKVARKVIDSDTFERLMLDTCKDNRNVTYLCRNFPPRKIEWKYGTLECVNCGSPPTIEGAKASGTSHLPGGVATYICDDNKQLVGDNSTTCRESGNWTSVNASCKFKCGPPPKIEGANASSTSQLPGDVASYICNDDKVLVGDNSTTCRESGNWTSVNASCKFKCGPPPKIEGANSSSTSQLPGDVASYICDYDKVLVGDNSTTCLESGNWTTVTASCKLIKPIPKCTCRKPASTVKEVAEAVVALKKNLTLKKENLLKTKLKKESVIDERTSSAVLGYTVIIAVTVVLGSLIIPDIINFLEFISRGCKGVGPKHRQIKIYYSPNLHKPQLRPRPRK